MQIAEKPSAIAKVPKNPAIVIPAFNEGETVRSVLTEIRQHCDFPVYLVDDSSTDNTAEVARDCGATVLRLANQLGAWGATQAGIRYALKEGHDAVITMDADGQHDPAFIGALLEPLQNNEADVCIGSWPERGSMLRQIAWRWLRATSGIPFEDLTSGFRAYSHIPLVYLASWRATYLDFQDVGVLSLLLKKGARVVDTPTPMRGRANGQSKVFRSWLVVFYYMCHTLLLGLTKRRIGRYGHNESPMEICDDPSLQAYD